MEKVYLSDLIESTQKKLGNVSKKDTDRVIKTFLEEVKLNLAKGNDVNLYKFCNFLIKTRPKRTYPNPSDMSKTVTIEEHKIVQPKVSESLKTVVRMINSGIL